MTQLPAKTQLLACTILVGLISNPVVAENHDWQFEVTPYVWAAGLEGDISTGGGMPIGSPVENEYSFFALENLDLAGFLSFEARKGRWRLLADSLYIAYSDDFGSGPIRTDLEVEGVILEGALGYRLPQYEQIELIGGGRFFSIRNKIELTPGPAGSGKVDWADPFIGARISYELDSKWYASLRGDIGGFGVSSDPMYNAAVTLGYRVNENINIKLGYRYLFADFEKKLFNYDVAVSGFGLGLGIRF